MASANGETLPICRVFPQPAKSSHHTSWGIIDLNLMPHAMLTMNGQDCVGQPWALPHLSKGRLTRKIPSTFARDLLKTKKVVAATGVSNREIRRGSSEWDRAGTGDTSRGSSG